MERRWERRFHTTIADINSEDRLIQETFAEYLSHSLGWDSVYAYKTETFGPQGTLGRVSDVKSSWFATCGRRSRA